jgi:phage terminase small subunit
MKLTPKQEAFAQSVASGKTQSDAYRTAYGAGKTKAASVQQSASRVMANVKVSSRVAELREPAVKKAQMTLESHLDDLKGLRNMAVKKEQFSAAIAAEVARGKASGLYVEKTELSGPGGAPMDINHTIAFITPNGKG